MLYTTILIDLDNTLFDFTKSEFCAARQTLAHFGLPSDDGTVRLYSKINKGFWESYERGEIAKEEIYEGRFKSLLDNLKMSGDTAAICEFYTVELAAGYHLIEGAAPILSYLKERGYRIYAVTNGRTETQYSRITGSGIGGYFDGVYISENIGFKKPEREFFEYVISHIPEKDKAKMLIIGDSQSSDILGGMNAGIDTCWFCPDNRAADYPSRFKIKKLNELKEIL